MKIGRVVPEICSRTDRHIHTHRHGHHYNTLPPYRRRSDNDNTTDLLVSPQWLSLRRHQWRQLRSRLKDDNKQTNRITTVRFLAGSCVNFHGNKPLHQRGITASFTCITEGFQQLPRYYRRPITVQGCTLHLNRLIGEICGPNGNRRYYCDNSSYYPRSGLQ